jgi:hypothetical protein
MPVELEELTHQRHVEHTTRPRKMRRAFAVDVLPRHRPL